MLSDDVPETVIDSVVTVASSVGVVIVTVGKIVSSGVYVTVMRSVTMLRDESVASTVMLFLSSVRIMSAFQLVVPVARIPFTVTDATAMLSEAVPEIVIMDVVTAVSYTHLTLP